MKDGAIGLFFMGIAVVLFVSSLTIPPPRWEPLGAAFMARAFAGGLFLAGLLLGLTSILSKRAERVSYETLGTSDGDGKITYSMTLQLFGALVLYLIGLELGRGANSYFVVSIGFFMLCAFILAPHVFRKPVQLLLTGVAACVLCGFIGWGFSQVLYVSLP